MGAVAMQTFDIDEEERQQKTSGLTKDEIIDFAKSVIRNFFADKPYYCGGPIPQHLLTTKKRVDLVLDCTLDQAIDIAYEALEQDLTLEDEEYVAAGGVSPDIKTLIGVLHEMSRCGVPQELSNGMLVLYLEFCLGANVVYA
jgi:hypothetical protein